MRTARPLRRIAPPEERRSPKTVSATSVRPEPTSPAIPTISPARRENETSRNRPAAESFVHAQQFLAGPTRRGR